MKAKMNIKGIMLTTLIIYFASMLFINICLATNTGKINVEAAKLREEAKADCKTLELITMGEEVEILGEDGEYYKVKYKKITGYVKKDIVDREDKKENNQIVTENTVEEKTETKVEQTTTENKETSSSEEILKGEKYKIKENIKIKVIPLISSIELNELTKGIEIEVEEVLNDWARVKTSDGKLGWIRKNKILTKKEEAEQLAKEAQAREAERIANARKVASRNAASRTTQTVVKFTESATSTEKGNQIVAYAKQFLGCKYVYGGSTPNGFDCSGFTQYVYKHFGVSLNRTAAAQYSNGTSVSSLQPGDLVMFGKSGIGHVGIYIGGNSFIHAENSGTGVVISSLSSGYYKTNYVGARRIF